MMSIAIRPYEEADAPRIFEAARESSASIFPWLPWCRPDYSLADARAFVAEQPEAFLTGRAFEHAIVSADGGDFLGGCGLNAIRWARRTANLGYWVRDRARGRGVATAAVRLLVDWARAHTTLVRIEALVATGNTASLRVAEKAGGVRERVDARRLPLHGVLHDAVVFSFTLARVASPT